MRKKVLALFALICCFVMTLGVFVACNDDTGTGGNGAGDSIFNEGASLDDIITALENAESFTLTTTQHRMSQIGDFNLTEDATSEYRINKTAYSYTASSTDIEGKHEHENHYEYRSNGIDYSISLSYSDGVYADGNIEKSTTQTNGNDYFVNGYNNLFTLITEFLTANDKNEIIVNVPDSYVSYVEGSAYVKLNGDSLEIGYEETYSDYANWHERVTHIISGVNATTVEIPDEVRALESEAEWSDYVNYNGVSYSKRTDADGSEYYVVTYNPDGAPIEETINTLPVRR